MALPTNRLPSRFPVGATYVVEGYHGAEGNFRVVARYVVLPGGRRINVPADLSTPSAPRAFAFRHRAAAKRSQPKTEPTTRGGKKFAARRGTS